MEQARARGWANPSSVHAAGRASRQLLDAARDQVAAIVGARSTDVVFTCGGTEACNLGVMGLCSAAAGAHVVTTTIEHPAVARSVAELRAQGAEVTELPVIEGLAPDLSALKEALRENTKLVAIQWVNHETGTLFPIEAYAQLCAERGVPLFVDGTQALGKVQIDLRSLPITGLALASHKVGGPAGAGALIVRRTCELTPRQLGGGQERGRRAGSPDVVSIAGFGAACGAVQQRLSAQPQIAKLRDAIEQDLVQLGAQRNGLRGERVATVTNVSLPAMRGADMVAALDLEGLCCSSGAACSSGLASPSPVLRAMYPGEPERALGALRLSFGPESLQLNSQSITDKLHAVFDRLQE